MGWKGKSNGELLAAMLAEAFEGLVTADKNLRYQQNFATYPIPVIVLNALFITYGMAKKQLPDLGYWCKFSY
jgi:hypothetical protein